MSELRDMPIVTVEQIVIFRKKALQIETELEQYKSYIENDAQCPCCGQAMECMADCTFKSDCPNDYDKMMYAREVLRGVK